MPDASPAAIAVALEHGQNFCWDAGQCRLRYVWYGAFVDPWPVWRGNGNGLAKVLGTKYWESDLVGTIQIGNIESKPKFLGYKKINGQPENRGDAVPPQTRAPSRVVNFKEMKTFHRSISDWDAPRTSKYGRSSCSVLNGGTPIVPGRKRGIRSNEIATFFPE